MRKKVQRYLITPSIYRIKFPRIFAIGDIHGCVKTFKKLLFDEIRIQKTDKIFCVGDYIDRGKDSKGVIDVILDLREKGYSIQTLMGNHEEMLLKAAQDVTKLELWIKNGGNATLRSFKISNLDDLPVKYLNFFRDTKYYITTSKYIFVHAGLNFNLDNPFLDKKAMLWTRDTEYDLLKAKGRIVIHGHTPTPISKIKLQVQSHNINLDSGCVYSNKKGRGYLTAIQLPQKRFISIKNIDG